MLGILLLIVLNLAIGYALAVFQHRPDLLPLRWRMFSSAGLATGYSGGQATDLPPAANANQTESVVETTALVGISKSQSAVAPASLPIENRTAETTPNKPDDAAVESSPLGAMISKQIQAAAEAIETGENDKRLEAVSEAAVQKHPSKSAENSVDIQSQQQAINNAVTGLKGELDQYRTELGKLDDQIQNRLQDGGSAFVNECVEWFDQLSDDYLQRREHHLEAIKGPAMDAVSDLAEPCLAAASQQAASIEETRANLAAAAQLADAAAACKSFLLATHRLTKSNESLDQQLGRTLAKIADATPAVNSLPPAAKPEIEAKPSADSVVNLADAVAKFVGANAPTSGRFSVALVEIDQMEKINGQHGRHVCDRIVQSVMQTFGTFLPSSTVSVDAPRQQVLCFQPDVAIREATGGIEQVRLRIGASSFSLAKAPVKVTVSCGIAEADCKGDPSEIVGHLQKLLHQAQRYGRNMSFFQEGEQSSPAIPPSIKVEKRVIEI